MPEQQRQDNDRTRKWMRQLEQERLNALSIAEGKGDPALEPGEGLPGPGAAAAADRRPTPRSASDDPRDWGRELERDRLSTAMLSNADFDVDHGPQGPLTAETLRRTFTSEEIINLAEILMPQETAAIRKQVLGTARAEFVRSMGRTSSASDDEPSSWKSQFERERQSMTALSGMAAYPGPGAASGAASSSMQSKVADKLSNSLLKSGLLEKISELVTKFQRVAAIIQTRFNIYATAPEDFVIPSLAALHVHKVFQDHVIRSFARDVEGLMQSKEFGKFKKLLGPVAGFFSGKLVTTILKMAKGFLLMEWGLIIVPLDFIVAAIILLNVVLFGAAFLCAKEPGTCLAGLGSNAISYFKTLF